jgi:hypothetical protein
VRDLARRFRDAADAGEPWSSSDLAIEVRKVVAKVADAERALRLAERELTEASAVSHTMCGGPCAERIERAQKMVRGCMAALRTLGRQP